MKNDILSPSNRRTGYDRTNRTPNPPRRLHRCGLGRLQLCYHSNAREHRAGDGGPIQDAQYGEAFHRLGYGTRGNSAKPKIHQGPHRRGKGQRPSQGSEGPTRPGARKRGRLAESYRRGARGQGGHSRPPRHAGQPLFRCCIKCGGCTPPHGRITGNPAAGRARGMAAS